MRNRMVRRTKWLPVHRLSFFEQTRGRMYRRHLEHIVIRQGREDACKSTGEHRLPCPRYHRTQCCDDRRGYLERALRALSALHTSQIEGKGLPGSTCRSRTSRGNGFSPSNVGEVLKSDFGAYTVTPSARRRFARIPRRYENCFDAAPFCREHLREHSAHTSQCPVECKLSSKKYFFGQGCKVVCSNKVCKRNREVIVRTFFFKSAGESERTIRLFCCFGGLMPEWRIAALTRSRAFFDRLIGETNN